MRKDKIIENVVSGYELPETPAAFMAFWEAKFKEVPVEFRGTTHIKIEAEDEYGITAIYLTVSYVRPETDDEMIIRERQMQRIKEESVARARATLAQYGETK